MKVGFYVQVFESLAVEYLSACLKEAGHETTIFYDPKLFNDAISHNNTLARVLNMEDLLVERILRSGVDLLAFSVVTDTYATSLRVSRKVKARSDIPVIFGGIHVTSVPERVVVQPSIDYIVVGEGEGAIVDIAEAFERGESEFEIPNVWYARDGRAITPPPRPPIEDLDALPFPDKALFFNIPMAARKKRYSIVASRGCPHSCTFCNNSVLKNLYRGQGRWFRRRSVDNVIAELQAGLERYRFSSVQFYDELFVENRDWLAEFAEKYADSIRKPFFCWVHPKSVNREAVALLEKAGCREVNMGVQSFYETTRREYLKRFDSNEDIKNAIAEVRRSRIFLSTSNILQVPGQSLDEVIDLARFYNENRVDMPLVSWLRYYPRTEIVDKARELGMLSEEEIERFEEALEERPFFKTQTGDDPRFEKVRNLILLTTVLPKPIIRLLIERKWYRRLPRADLFFFLIAIGFVYRTITTGKRRIVEHYTSLTYIQHVVVFTLMKVWWKLTDIPRRLRANRGHRELRESDLRKP